MEQPSKPDLSQKPGLFDGLKAVGVALSAAVSFEVAAKEFLGTPGIAGLIVPILSAVGLLAACLYIAFARAAVVGRKNRAGGPKFAASVRAAALAGTALLLGLVGFRLWNARPNFIAGQKYESGYLCDSNTGSPLNDSTVVVLSRSGQKMSAAQVLDSRGFFYAELDQHSFLPMALQVYGRDCAKPSLIDLDVGDRGLCPIAASTSPTVTVHEWRVACEKSP